MKSKASEFMNRSSARRLEDVPTVVVSRRGAVKTAAGSGTRRTFYNVDTLDKLVNTFDENERALLSDRIAK